MLLYRQCHSALTIRSLLKLLEDARISCELKVRGEDGTLVPVVGAETLEKTVVLITGATKEECPAIPS